MLQLTTVSFAVVEDNPQPFKLICSLFPLLMRLYTTVFSDRFVVVTQNKECE